MCEQCMAETTNHGEPLLGVLLVRATKDGHQMKAGQWGLVRENDPFVIFDKTPTMDPVHDMTDPAIEALEDHKPMQVWLAEAREFLDALVVSPDLGHWLIKQAKRDGFKPKEDGYLAMWLWHRMGHLLQIKITPTGEHGFDSGRARSRVVCAACRVILHENTTGAVCWTRDHLRGMTCHYGRPLRIGESP